MLLDARCAGVLYAQWTSRLFEVTLSADEMGALDAIEENEEAMDCNGLNGSRDKTQPESDHRRRVSDCGDCRRDEERVP